MLTNCGECGRQISDIAVACPNCGAPGPGGRRGGYEYKSELLLGEIPLIHIVLGPDPVTGRKRVAKGIIAIGDIALGLVAIGGVALGGFTFGGVSLGVLALGGCALGLLLAAGGLAVGFTAFGGLAIGYYAVGGLALGVHIFGAEERSPEMVEFMQWILGKSP